MNKYRGNLRVTEEAILCLLSKKNNTSNLGFIRNVQLNDDGAENYMDK